MSDDERVDLLVVGSGIAGLTAAVRAAAQGLRVGVVTKGTIDQTATGWAQGGVAAVLGQGPGDSLEAHERDTLAAGAGLCDEDAVAVLVREGPERVRELIAMGARFDRDPDGSLQLGREGGHSHARVVHAGGAATGAEIERALVAAVAGTAVRVHEHVLAVDLVVEGGSCRGVVVRDRTAGPARGADTPVAATHVLLATGGAGQVFSLTTNPLEATGDGVAMALRAGAAVADVEFVQFHPTALAVDRLPRPLVTEALRGEGALLRNASGERFVDELAPRDVVARAIVADMQASGLDHAWLDATPVRDFAARFPSLAGMLAGAGLDPARDWLPVAPAAHYLCGGVVTDLDGATSIPGLWAAGEVACTGVHGANRLASNSLLDGLVFGARVVEAIAGARDRARATGAMRTVLDPRGPWPGRPVAVSLPAAALAGVPGRLGRRDLQRAMSLGAGVLRDQSSLEATAAAVADVGGEDPELRNLASLAAAVVHAALARTESRGAHTRLDHPDTDPAWRRRLLVSTAAA